MLRMKISAEFQVPCKGGNLFGASGASGADGDCCVRFCPRKLCSSRVLDERGNYADFLRIFIEV
jgi:hypothetical protein